MKTARVVVESPSRADLVVQAVVGGSRSLVRGLFDHGCVTVDGAPSDAPGEVLAAGRTVEVTWDPKRRYSEKPKAPSVRSRAFRVVFEDDHLLVVDKSAGFLTVPTVKREKNTLVDEIARYLSKSDRITRRAYLVHRLDRDTSGLLVFGKSTAVGEALVEQFAEKKPEREYVAVVAGNVVEDRGTIESRLATDEDLDQYSTDDPDEGKLAITHFTVVERLRGCTWLKVVLETGRRNQIRVHFAERGHPVLGDQRYEVQRARHDAWPHARLALHARVLGFVHPKTGARLRFEAPLPSEFEQLKKRTRIAR
jgi:23S rRNA pseudouridine1911/1915/1917 synthase